MPTVAGTIHFHQLSQDLCFGQDPDDPASNTCEKALVDLMHVRIYANKRPLPPASWDFRSLNLETVEAILEKFPTRTRSTAAETLRQIRERLQELCEQEASL